MIEKITQWNAQVGSMINNGVKETFIVTGFNEQEMVVVKIAEFKFKNFKGIYESTVHCYYSIHTLYTDKLIKYG